MSKITGIVLIHGAGLNSSIWDELAREMNVPVLAIDFPGRSGHDSAIEGLTLEDYASSATDQIEKWSKGDFVIVAHSIGAFVGLRLASRFEGRLQGFVAISSVIPASGHSFVSSLPFPQRWIMPVILKLLGTKPPEKSIQSELCNDLTAEQTQRVVKGFTPESSALYTTRIHFDVPNTPRLYVKLTNDKSMPISLQDQMAKNLKADTVAILSSGHLPMMSQSKQLAAILSAFIGTSARREK